MHGRRGRIQPSSLALPTRLTCPPGGVRRLFLLGRLLHLLQVGLPEHGDAAEPTAHHGFELRGGLAAAAAAAAPCRGGWPGGGCREVDQEVLIGGGGVRTR